MAATAPRVLVANDQPALSQALCETLEAGGYRPCVAFTGPQALEEIERERPDLILLDVTMPQMDGFQVLDRMRANPINQEIPVILLTAPDADAEVVRGIRAGVAMCLTKPVEAARLAATITAILGPRLAGV